MNQTVITNIEDNHKLQTGQIVFPAGLAEIGSAVYLSQAPLNFQDDSADFIYVTGENETSNDMADWNWPYALPTQTPGYYVLYITTLINKVIISKYALKYSVDKY
jgi:hypothetical protein